MSFFGKIKQWFGIGGVKIELQIDPQGAKASGVFGGKIKITSKSEQQIKKIEAKMIEKWSAGRGEDRREKEFDLGHTNMIDLPFIIKAGEIKVMDFIIPFSLIKSDADECKEESGPGKMTAFATNEKSDYFIRASAEVQGTAFGPTDQKSITLA